MNQQSETQSTKLQTGRTNTVQNTSQLRFPRSPKQQKMLERGAKNAVLERSDRVQPRADIFYIRKGKQPRLRGVALLEAATFMHRRRGAKWASNDQEILDCLVSCSWGYSEAEKRRCDTVPIWLKAQIPARQRAGVGFLTTILMAHRAGAVGVLASLDELAALEDVSERTIRRWVERWDGGLIEVVQTWQRSPTKLDSERGYWKQLLRPGPQMLAAAGGELGILEGATGLTRRKSWDAKNQARAARKGVRAQFTERRNQLWQYRNQATGADLARTSTKTRVDSSSTLPRPSNGGIIPFPPVREKKLKADSIESNISPSETPQNNSKSDRISKLHDFVNNREPARDHQKSLTPVSNGPCRPKQSKIRAIVECTHTHHMSRIGASCPGCETRPRDRLDLYLDELKKVCSDQEAIKSIERLRAKNYELSVTTAEWTIKNFFCVQAP
jgi:hypothetical protein